MTKKHFVVIAQAFCDSRPMLGTIEYQQWLKTRAEVIKACKWANGGFDAERFIEATEQD